MGAPTTNEETRLINSDLPQSGQHTREPNAPSVRTAAASEMKGLQMKEAKNAAALKRNATGRNQRRARKRTMGAGLMGRRRHGFDKNAMPKARLTRRLTAPRRR